MTPVVVTLSGIIIAAALIGLWRKNRLPEDEKFNPLKNINIRKYYLANHHDAQIRLEGNTDERGSREYNLALGERRANAARDYLMTYGISGKRISVISYGKERPVNYDHGIAPRTTPGGNSVAVHSRYRRTSRRAGANQAMSVPGCSA